MLASEEGPGYGFAAAARSVREIEGKRSWVTRNYGSRGSGGLGCSVHEQDRRGNLGYCKISFRQVSQYSCSILKLRSNIY